MDLISNYTISLTDKEYNLLAKFIYDRSGINLGDNKKELVKARLMKRIKFLRLESFRDYYEYLMADSTGEEIVKMLDAISTNVTSFFREKQHFKYLYSSALAEITSTKLSQKSNRIRIWSSACSSGEEPYTIAMIIHEFFQSLAGWDMKLLATDISTAALSLAKEGVYDREKTRIIPLTYLEKYFTKVFKDSRIVYEVSQKLKDLIAFRRLNLMDEYFPFNGKFDIIFCRNVMIYFDKQTQEKLVNKFYRYLEPGGYLFIGHSESLIGTNLHMKPVAPAIYRKI